MLEAAEWRKVQALQDFQHAISAFRHFGEIDDNTADEERHYFRCFHDYAVVAYCRPFAKSNGLPLLSLKGIGVRANQAEKALHDRLINYRNKVVAHTDADRMRLLVTSYTAFEGLKYAIPHVVEDKSFEFSRDINAIDAWIIKLMTPLATFVFDTMQEFPHGTRILKDYISEL